MKLSTLIGVAVVAALSGSTVDATNRPAGLTFPSAGVWLTQHLAQQNKLFGPLRGPSDSACNRTSLQLLRSCAYDQVSDLFEHLGVCENLEDEDAGDCRTELFDEYRESSEECGAVYAARNDLCDLLPDDGPYLPEIDPDNFLSPAEVAQQPNRYMPLIVGRTWLYANDEEIVEVTVTDDTREILGVECFSVRDVVSDHEGEVIEDTIDWFAQDRDGNVWYFGEIARNFEDGYLEDIDGSFVADGEGIFPGIVMFAQPEVGVPYRQEFSLDEAEDAGTVLDLAADESSPFTNCNGQCLMTLDFTPLEPDAVEHKFYAPGVGLIVEVDPESGERLELLSVQDLCARPCRRPACVPYCRKGPVQPAFAAFRRRGVSG